MVLTLDARAVRFEASKKQQTDRFKESFQKKLSFLGSSVLGPCSFSFKQVEKHKAALDQALDLSVLKP